MPLTPPTPSTPPPTPGQPDGKPGASASPRRRGNTPHQRFPTVSTGDQAATRAFAFEAARILADDKCEDVVCLDVQGLSQVSDYIIIGSGSSDRQMRSAADDVKDLAQRHGSTIFRRSVDDRATWIVVDCIDVVVHVFEPNTRAHYDLEMLWADAPRLEWYRPGEKPRNRAGIE